MKHLIILIAFLFISCQSELPTVYSVSTEQCVDTIYQHTTDTIYETEFLTTNKVITKCPDFMQEEINRLNKIITTIA